METKRTVGLGNTLESAAAGKITYFFLHGGYSTKTYWQKSLHWEAPACKSTKAGTAARVRGDICLSKVR